MVMSLTGFANPLKLCATFLSKRPGIFLLWRNARSRWGTLNLDEGTRPFVSPVQFKYCFVVSLQFLTTLDPMQI